MQQPHHEPIAVFQFRVLDPSLQSQQGVMVRPGVKQSCADEKPGCVVQGFRLPSCHAFAPDRNLEDLAQHREQSGRLSLGDLVLAGRLAVIQKRYPKEMIRCNGGVGFGVHCALLAAVLISLRLSRASSDRGWPPWARNRNTIRSPATTKPVSSASKSRRAASTPPGANAAARS